MADRKRVDIDAELERLVARELSGPPADAVFRSELRGRLLASHGAGVAEDVQPVGTRAARLKARRRRSGRPLIGLAIAAVLALAFLAARPVLFPAPVAELGKLPRLAVEPQTGQGAAGGPGYTFDFSYSLSPQLAAGWPDLPRQETAYRMKPAAFNEQHVAAVAARLGVSAPVVREGWQDGYLLAVDPEGDGPFIRMFPSGYTIYLRPYDYVPTPPGDLPSEQRALQIARAWLVSSGFVPEGELDAGSVTLDPENGFLYVRFKPAVPVPVVSISPFAIVQVGRGEEVVMGSATWFAHDASSPYPLRSVEEAWQVVKGGGGVLEYEGSEFPGPVGEDNVVRGQATVQEVHLGWWLAVDPDRIPYLIPVYAFSGKVTVADNGGTVEVPFEVWAPAVKEAYVRN